MVNNNQGSNFIVAQETPAGQFEPVNTVIGYDESKYAPTQEVEQTSVQTETAPQTEQTAPEKATQQSEAHRLAQLAKTERKLQQKMKEADAIIKQAAQYQGAFNSPDLIESLEKLGLKPGEIYRKLTDHALKEPVPEKPKDPMQEELDKTKAELKSYAEAQKQMQEDLNAEREAAAHMTAITQHVAPFIQSNKDKYETAIDVYQGIDNFIKEVYTQMYNEFQNSGTSYTAQEAADAMEEYWSNNMVTAIQNAKSLNKYKHYFKDEVEEAKKSESSMNSKPLTQAERFERVLSRYDQETKSVAEDPKPSQPKTLTNNMNTSSTVNTGGFRKVNSPLVDRNAYINSLLKK